MVSYILLEKKRQKEESNESIIIAAAEIIKEELRELRKDNQVYPTFEELRSSESQKEWVPESLQLLLQYLIPSNVKQLNIGQCIAQASRSRSIICPVLFGLGVQVEKSFASKWLVNHLYRLGYSISCDEVLRFKHSMVDSSESPIPSDGSFCQWVADNADHNQVTLTNKGTFRGMGVISISTSSTVRNTPVKRIKERAKASSIVKNKGIHIVGYTSRSDYGLLKLKLDSMNKLSAHHYKYVQSYNLFWQCSWFFRASYSNWSGYMQDLTKTFSEQRKDQISSDETCIYSTLLFVCDQDKKLGIQVPSTTLAKSFWNNKRIKA